MNDTIVAPLARAQKLAETANWLALGAIVLILLSTVGEFLVGPVIERVETLEGGIRAVLAILNVVMINTILASPALLLVGALFDMRVAITEYEAGRFFSVKANHAVRSAGEWTLYAIGMKVVGAPTLHSWVTGDARGIRINYESFDLGLVAFAAFVVLVGRLLEAAAAIKAENDEIV
jgi:hypothetical protein